MPPTARNKMKRKNEFIKKFKNQPKKFKVLSIGGIVAVIAALAVYFVCEFAVGEAGLSFWPVWSFFITLFYATGLFYLVYGLIKKFNAILIIGIACIILGTFFLLISFKLPWSVVIVVSATLVIFLYGITFMIKPNENKNQAETTDDPAEEHVDDEETDGE